ncbi:MAG: hypothetical protein ISS01_01285, partial [Nanoarchaeota archaeon]|nr:hypothetical protein [Nanoarchaeota archaeon]
KPITHGFAPVYVSGLQDKAKAYRTFLEEKANRELKHLKQEKRKRFVDKLIRIAIEGTEIPKSFVNFLRDNKKEESNGKDIVYLTPSVISLNDYNIRAKIFLEGVIAHEIFHHLQRELGIAARFPASREGWAHTLDELYGLSFIPNYLEIRDSTCKDLAIHSLAFLGKEDEEIEADPLVKAGLKAVNDDILETNGSSLKKRIEIFGQRAHDESYLGYGEIMTLHHLFVDQLGSLEN